MLPVIQLTIPDKLVREFKVKAKDIFPLEQYAVAIGTIDGSTVEVEDIIYPEFKSTDCQVFLNPIVLSEIALEAKECGLRVLGDIHSHCYEEEYSIDGYKMDRARSEADHYYAPLFIIQGICVIIKHKGKMKASIKWWGPTMHIELK